MSSQTKALIFDFDGLILDTEMPEFVAWSEIYDEHGCEFDLNEWAQSLGRAWHYFSPYDDIEAKLGRPVDRASIRARKKARFVELIAEEDLLPGVADYLADGKRLGLKMAIASSSSREWIVEHLSRFEIERLFDAICCVDDVANAKPDPELYLRALDALGVASEEAIALEDSPNGILAAQRAGIYCVAVPNPVTRQFDLSGADMRLKSLSDLSLTELIAFVEKDVTTRASGAKPGIAGER